MSCVSKTHVANVAGLIEKLHGTLPKTIEPIHVIGPISDLKASLSLYLLY